MKNVKKFLKYYTEAREQALQKFGNTGYYLNMEEFEAANVRVFEKYLAPKEDPLIRLKLYTTLLREDDFFFFLVFSAPKLDFRDLANVLYQTSRRASISRAHTASILGVSHNELCGYLCGFAANDFQTMEKLVARNLTPKKLLYAPDIAAGLIFELLGNPLYSEDFLGEQLQKFQKKKQTTWEAHLIGYLLALKEKNPEKASLELQELCVAYQRQGYPMEKMDKCFMGEIHGLYRLARQVDTALFDAIKMPEHDGFFQEFEHWQASNHFPKAGLFYRYPEPLSYMNQILEASLPEMQATTYYNDYDGKTHLVNDHETFTKNLHMILKRV